MEALGKFGEHSKNLVTLGYSFEQILRFFRALPTSRVNPLLDRARQIMYDFFNGNTNTA